MSLIFGVEVFLSAGIMQWVESEVITVHERAQCPSNGCLDFLDAFYYIVVTVSSSLLITFLPKPLPLKYKE